MINNFCIYNSIKTPDGTILTCHHPNDYQSHSDLVSGEHYMNDGLYYYVRRSINAAAYEDLSVWIDMHNPVLTQRVREVKFWGSYGKDGMSKKHYLSTSEMTNEHIDNILKTQLQLKGSPIETIFKLEQEYRKENNIFVKD